eukprot:14614451-Ditylum_brightwellii.AAC.1
MGYQNTCHIEEMIASLRTEAMSYLSAMVFLKQLCLYHKGDMQDNTTIHFTDNKGIVNRMDQY